MTAVEAAVKKRCWGWRSDFIAVLVPQRGYYCYGSSTRNIVVSSNLLLMREGMLQCITAVDDHNTNGEAVNMIDHDIIYSGDIYIYITYSLLSVQPPVGR